MHNFKTQEFINSLEPEPGFMLIRLMPEDSYTSLIVLDTPKQPFTAKVVKTGGPEYMLSNGKTVNSRRKIGEYVIIDPVSYPAYFTYSVEGVDNELPTTYRLVPESIAICVIRNDKDLDTLS